MGSTGILNVKRLGPMRGVVVQPPGARPGIEAVAVPGTEGPRGPAAGLLTAIAAVTVSGHRAVRPVNGGIAPVSSDDTQQANTLIGLTRGAALAGGSVEIVTHGEIEEPSWAWSLGPVYAGIAGALTQTPPMIGFVQRVGIALSATQITVLIGPAVIKA